MLGDIFEIVITAAMVALFALGLFFCAGMALEGDKAAWDSCMAKHSRAVCEHALKISN